jgi:hypothetical protein
VTSRSDIESRHSGKQRRGGKRNKRCDKFHSIVITPGIILMSAFLQVSSAQYQLF